MEKNTIKKTMETIHNRLSSESIYLDSTEIDAIYSSDNYIAISNIDNILEDELDNILEDKYTELEDILSSNIINKDRLFSDYINNIKEWKEIVIQMLPDNIGLAKQIEIEELINNISNL